MIPVVSPRLRALIVQDLAIFLTAFISTGVLDGPVTVSAITASAVVAVKIMIRTLVPAPAKAPAVVVMPQVAPPVVP